MSKSKYCIASFPLTSMKSPLATLSEHVLETIDHIFEILQMHSNESYEQSPRRIFCNMMQNNESIFGQGVSNIISSTSTSEEEKSSQESTSPMKGVSVSTGLVQKLPFVDRTNEDLPPKSLDTKSTSPLSQRSVEFCEKEKMPSSPVEDDKMDIATSKDAEMEIDPKDENKESMESKEDIKDLFRRNSAEIRSVSVIRHAGFIGVEVDIDIDSDCTSDGSSLMKTEQKSSPSKKVAIPGKSEINIKSPSDSPSKSDKLTDPQPISSESFLPVDYSSPNIMDFLAERLVSIFKSRKTCMEQIDNYFKNFLVDARDFLNTIDNIKYVVENLPVSREPYLSYDFLKLREDLINKASEMSEKAELLLKGIKEDIEVLGNGLNKMDIFEKHNIPLLPSSKDSSKPTTTDLQTLETHLKKICTEADGTVILKDDRGTILLKSITDFKWLVNHFVKFLIVTEMLKPAAFESSQIGTDK